MRELEKYISANRDEFDSETPGKELWSKIDKRRRTGARIFSLLSLKQMVACVLIFVSGGMVFLMLEKKPIKTLVNPRNEAAQEEYIDTFYQGEVNQMRYLVEIKQVELKQVAKANPALYKNFRSDLEQLNTYYLGLQKEFQNNPNKEQLLEAMIQNLKLQQELLSQQLDIFQKIKLQKNEKRNKDI